MKKQLYAMYDNVAQEAYPIFEANNDSVAWRMFEDAKERMSKAEEGDFSLWCLAMYDNETMVLNRNAIREVNINIAMEADEDVSNIS